jgi:hypothetical protein
MRPDRFLIRARLVKARLRQNQATPVLHTRFLRSPRNLQDSAGMQTLNESLLALVAQRKIDRAAALGYSEDKVSLLEEFEHRIDRPSGRKRA